MNRKEKQVEELLTPTVESLGCSIWGIEYLSQGKHSKLRVYIDSADGVNVDDCAAVSRHVSDILDVEEFSNNTYTLEVSSPGLDRTLTKPAHFQRFMGEDVRVKLRFPLEGRRNFKGALKSADEEHIEVEVDGQSHSLPLATIESARLVPQL